MSPSSLLPLLAALGFAAPLRAQERGHSFAGRVTDDAGAPLAGAQVRIVELGRTATTAADGAFHLAAVPAGRYVVRVTRLGYAPAVRPVVVGPDAPPIALRLREAGVALAAVQVTATPTATRAADSPQPTSVVEGAELRRAQGAAVGDAIEQLPGVRSLGMTTGIGKPVIRGMTHYRIVTLDNGQRSETQAWGHDHSPSVESAAAERVEVIRGPASVLHGSDALGGVVNVVAPAIPDAIGVPRFARGTVAAGYDARVRGGDGTLTLEGAAGGLGGRLALTARGGGDMRTPAGVLANTRHRAVAPDVAFGWRGGRASVAARYTSRHEYVEILDDPVASPGYTGYQRIATERAQLEISAPLGGSRVQAAAGVERNDRREFPDAAAAAPALNLLVRNATAHVHLHHAPVGPVTGTLGVSALASDFENRGAQTLMPSSRTRTAALFAFEQLERGRWRASLGARWDVRALETDGEPSIDVAPQRRTFHALTGSAGALYRVTEPVALVLNVARGFRAPAPADLFVNGFHEGTRAFERGDPTLDVETSLNTELGVRITRHDLIAEATAFVSLVDDYIYLRPFGSGGGALDSLHVVQGDARLVGAEARVAWRPLRPLTLQLSGDVVRGDNRSANVPLTFVPPPRMVAGVRLEREGRGATRNAYLSATAEANWRQTRLDPRDVAPPGYTLLSLGAGLTRLVPRGALAVDVTLRNALDARHRSFMSRYKEYALAAGRALAVRVVATL